jgi:predicted membrane channel-forming protein YqfA (hemolysin III family)
MKALFITSVVCAAMTLLAVFCLSAMTIAPRDGAEDVRGQMLLAAGAFFVLWLFLAAWARRCLRVASTEQPPLWLRRLLVWGGVVYSIGVLLFAVG